MRDLDSEKKEKQRKEEGNTKDLKSRTEKRRRENRGEQTRGESRGESREESCAEKELALLSGAPQCAVHKAEKKFPDIPEGYRVCREKSLRLQIRVG